ncbi:hypothetical protein PV327_010544 [Microctonus hyperodae]|uniref:protein-serine/threonine phosphatase n=1 Tax=Microctonus hyperodae TaxID=165561 RepID=A0AA39FS51_MICHY|nr:hypothetical protein PV327_010544 [Microctonus hyperodae]
MGAYLSEPVTNKISNDESGKNVAFGASSMQGWRVSQEDAHNSCINYDDNVSLFAVYDGHGGHEVATYCASKLPEFIKQTDAYKRGDIRQALIDAFLGFDATLAKPEIIKILKEISGNNVSEKEKDKDGNEIDSDDEDNVSNLKREAEMPLEQVMAKYQLDSSQFKNEKFGKRLNTPVATSPYLRCRRARDKAGGSSSSLSPAGAGCSSSSSSSSSSSAAWNTNEADVSSSCQPCGSTSGDKSSVINATATASTTAAASVPVTNTDNDDDDNKKKSNSPGSSETDRILDSTTSNGELPHECTTKGSVKNVESSKTIDDMPDSSEDVGDQVSPSKTTSAEEFPTKSADVNGSEVKDKIIDADCSRGDNVSSSSTMENGEITQQEGISSSSRRASAKASFYSNLWDKSIGCEKEGDVDDDDDDDDEDENDESFDAVALSASDDDNEDMDNDSEDIDDDDDDDDDEEDDDDEDEYDDDDDVDEDDESGFTINEEPGSDSGCTAVVAILKGNDLYVANAGDSRCVLCRDGEALELSLDHKPEDEPEMKRIVKAGGKVTIDGRVNGGLNLSRALGDHAYKQNAELPPQDQMISALPDVRHITIDPKRDEFMVLACDGIWNFMSSNDVVKFVSERINKTENLSKICEELFDHCLSPNTMGDGTGCDNMTAVIVKFKSITPLNENNVTDDNDVAVAASKKRPISPSARNDKIDETINNDNKSVDECKRAKIETV